MRLSRSGGYLLPLPTLPSFSLSWHRCPGEPVQGAIMLEKWPYQKQSLGCQDDGRWTRADVPFCARPAEQSFHFIYLFFFPFVFTGESSGGTRAPRWDHLSRLLPSRLPQVAAVGWAAAWQNSFQEKPPEPASWAAAPRRLGAAMEGARPRGCKQESEPWGHRRRRRVPRLQDLAQLGPAGLAGW